MQDLIRIIFLTDSNWNDASITLILEFVLVCAVQLRFGFFFFFSPSEP